MGTPVAPLVATAYKEGIERIGEWRLLGINDDRTQLIIQYSQGAVRDTKRDPDHRTSAAVAL
jgi:hypothetical protein